MNDSCPIFCVATEYSPHDCIKDPHIHSDAGWIECDGLLAGLACAHTAQQEILAIADCMGETDCQGTVHDTSGCSNGLGEHGVALPTHMTIIIRRSMKSPTINADDTVIVWELAQESDDGVKEQHVIIEKDDCVVRRQWDHEPGQVAVLPEP